MPDPAQQHASPKSDLEIAQAAHPRPIVEVAADKLGVPADSLEPYGRTKAKPPS
jgi:formate--tetrahydrofolate ligase